MTTTPSVPAAAPACPDCSTPLLAGDTYCAACGRPSGAITWSLSTTRKPGRGGVSVRPGDGFFVVAENRGLAPVRVRLDLGDARGVRLSGAPARQVAPGQSQAFELKHQPGEGLAGAVQGRSEDDRRHEWWERRAERTTPIRLNAVRLREERWVVGSPALLLPPGVRGQCLRVWNDADTERVFVGEVPSGFRVAANGESVERRPPAVPPRGSVELALRQAPALPGLGVDATWVVGPDAAPVRLARMPAPPRESGADLVVALDFGTRNTRVRVRWRRTLVAAKPAGKVDVVGDHASNGHFPSQMVLHLQERTFRWGTEAAQYIGASRMAPDEVAVVNLKTDLREGQDRYTRLKPEWTSEELLRRFLERVLHRLDQYLATADPAQPLSRSGLSIRYVVCRPILDANEGDEKGRRYEGVIRTALAACGVPPESVSFVQEPVAAAIGVARRRDGELLSLPNGSAVAVIDSGGGTTDVALARVKLEDGRISLDLAGSFALRLDENNPAMEALERFGQADREVGGNVLDWFLAHKLTTRASDVLEADGRKAPPSIWPEVETQHGLDAARVRELVINCRTMKERFARFSTQYLNRPASQAAQPGELLPFPTRDDLRGVRLVHALYDDKVLAPILRPVVEELSGRMDGSQAAGNGVRPSEVKRVFYVGGTNVDPFVREHFARAFPLAARESYTDAQSDERIAERLHAVVDGALWSDERLFPPAPVALTLRLSGGERPLLAEGAALPPVAVAAPRFFTETLDAGAELDAELIASGGGLPETLVVARAFHQNETDMPVEVTLSITISRERGAVADVVADGVRLPQWRVALTEMEAVS